MLVYTYVLVIVQIDSSSSELSTKPGSFNADM